MSQSPKVEESQSDSKGPPPKAALVLISIFLVLAILVTTIATLHGLYVTLAWETTQAAVIGHETSVSSSKRGSKTNYRPIFSVEDESGKKNRTVSRASYDSTSGIEVGDVVTIKHNGAGAAYLNTFGTLFLIPLIGILATAVLAIALNGVYQKRKAAAQALAQN